MEITNVRIRKILDQGKLKAVASITIDDAFAVHDIKILCSDNGYFIAMPSRKSIENTYMDIAHPTNREARSMMMEKILEAYNNAQDE